MPRVQFPVSRAEFRRLPRNAAYRYAYHDGQAHLNPAPRYYHAVLPLPSLDLDGAARVPIRPFADADWDALVPVFADAFARQQPFAGLGRRKRTDAARASLAQTRDGGDGPWIPAASHVAVTADGETLGAVLITLVPLTDPREWEAYVWTTPPPPNCVALRLGRPHLTWVFVRPETAGRGVGTALLGRAAESLRRLGFDELHTTFIAGNDSSMLWHWRSGFRLCSYPSSRRGEA